MTDRARGAHGRRLPAAPVALLAVGLSFGLAGCSDLLDVENPNNVKQEDFEKPVAAEAIVNGVQAVLTKAIAAVMAPYATATDEVTWIGSRDAWQQLDKGFLSDPNNEFTDTAFPVLAQARWFADEAVKVLEGHMANEALADSTLLARAYMYSAIAYITIADMFENIAFSDRAEPGTPIGEENMYQLYDMAIANLDKGITVALAAGDTALMVTMTALKARGAHAKAVWELLNPPGSAPSQPLVAAGTADAQAVLDAVGTSDWRFQLTNANSVDDIAYSGEASLAYNINDRGELQFGPAYVQLDDDDEIGAYVLNDPVTGSPDVPLQRAIEEFRAGYVYSAYTIVSAREMHLILAEAELLAGTTGGARLHINHVRAMDGITPYDETNPAHPSALEMLKHTRRVNLFLQGRRLSDMYRFGEKAPEWDPAEEAWTTPGTFLPVTGTELRSNCNYPNSQC